MTDLHPRAVQASLAAAERQEFTDDEGNHIGRLPGAGGHALAALIAAAPILTAQALRDAADDYERAMDEDTMHTSTWNFLRSRADELDPQDTDADRRRMGLTTPPRPAGHNPVA